VAGAGPNGSTGTTRDALCRQWKQRWETGRRQERWAADRTLEKAFQGGHLRLYQGLKKAHSSILCQARTGRIGLRAFLFQRGVPEVNTPVCPCGEGSQTSEHLSSECLKPRSTPLRAMGYTSLGRVRETLSDYKTAAKAARILIPSGWLEEYRLFLKLDFQKALEAIRAGITIGPPLDNIIFFIKFNKFI
jgi:hypothetical protein